jgi:hypothetical protein
MDTTRPLTFTSRDAHLLTAIDEYLRTGGLHARGEMLADQLQAMLTRLTGITRLSEDTYHRMRAMITDAERAAEVAPPPEDVWPDEAETLHDLLGANADAASDRLLHPGQRQTRRDDRVVAPTLDLHARGQLETLLHLNDDAIEKPATTSHIVVLAHLVQTLLDREVPA